jgi:GNAT superfamily N-acetyltransferase
MDQAAAIDLQRRVLTAFVRVLGAGSEGSAVFERDGVIASVVPAVPTRSVINSVVYRDPNSLLAALDDLARTYEEAGVLAWTVWVPEMERDAAAGLKTAGHKLDARPTAMLLDLARLGEPDRDEHDWDAAATPAEVGRINDLAYGMPAGSFGAAITRIPPDVPLRLYRARVDGEPACVLGTLDDGDDCGVYLVATLKEHRGRGLARKLLHIALAESRQRGCLTSTLQSSPMGFPVYDRLGYESICALEMWERRKSSP